VECTTFRPSFFLSIPREPCSFPNSPIPRRHGRVMTVRRPFNMIYGSEATSCLFSVVGTRHAMQRLRQTRQLVFRLSPGSRTKCDTREDHDAIARPCPVPSPESACPVAILMVRRTACSPLSPPKPYQYCVCRSVSTLSESLLPFLGTGNDVSAPHASPSGRSTGTSRPRWTVPASAHCPVVKIRQNLAGALHLWSRV
jgi:hypothetical protein